MKYCTKCGKELMDEAVICIGCGCAVEDPRASTTQKVAKTEHSSQYPKLKEYGQAAQNIYIFSLISIILSMGIGIIFAIIASVKMNRLQKQKPNFSLTLPNEIEELNQIEKKLKIATVLYSVTFLILVCLFTFGLLIAYIGSVL